MAQTSKEFYDAVEATLNSPPESQAVEDQDTDTDSQEDQEEPQEGEEEPSDDEPEEEQDEGEEDLDTDDEPEEDEEGDEEEPEEDEDEEDEEEEELKVDGKTTKVKKSELKRLAQKGFAADKRFQEAAELRKEAERHVQEANDATNMARTVLGALKENPFQAILDLKLSEGEKPADAQQELFEAAIQFVTPYIEENVEKDEDRRRWLKEKRVWDLERRQAEREKQRIEQERTREIQKKQQQEAIKEIDKALDEVVYEGSKDVSDDDRATFRREVARTIINHQESFGKTLTPRDAALKVKEELQKRFETLAGGLPADVLGKLSPKLEKQLRDRSVAATKAKRKSRTTRRDKASKSTESHSGRSRGRKPPPMRPADFFDKYVAPK